MVLVKLVPVGPRDHAKVDDEDYDKCAGFRWSRVTWRTCEYAKINGTQMKMHSLILGTKEEIDHIDGDGLNNQKSNLRVVTHAQNIQNQRIQQRSHSGYRGVTLFQPETRNKCWRARIKTDGNDRTIGYFYTAREAAIAWNEEAKLAWGEFARLNAIREEGE